MANVTYAALNTTTAAITVTLASASVTIPSFGKTADAGVTGTEAEWLAAIAANPGLLVCKAPLTFSVRDRGATILRACD